MWTQTNYPSLVDQILPKKYFISDSLILHAYGPVTAHPGCLEQNLHAALAVQGLRYNLTDH